MENHLTTIYKNMSLTGVNDESPQITSIKKTEHCMFSPVKVHESPVAKTPQRGNLTGNARKIRDSAAEIFNLIQEWNGYHITGSEILMKMNSLKSVSMKEGNPDQGKDFYSDGLQELCNELDSTCHKLADILKKMMATKAEVEGVIKLEKLKSTSDVPLFLTWPSERYGETFLKITIAYQMELKVKNCVKEKVAHTRTEDDRMFFISAWVHQPYVRANINVWVEALLKETGHR